MNIYAYDSESGEYLGAQEARESPLEPGIHLVPANATTIAPPDAVAGRARVWSGQAWTQVEDHRGETAYRTDTGAAQSITALGPLPAGVTAAAPGEHQIWDASTGGWVTDAAALAAAVRAQRDARLTACDWTQLADSPLAAEAKAAWAEYRQALRDLPAQADFPASVAWPAAPDFVEA